MATRKRGHGEGTIDRRPDGSWRGRIIVGYRPDGRVDRRTVSGKTRQEVQRALAEQRGRADVGLLGDAKAGRETLGAFLGVWLKAIEATMEPESLRRHRNNVEKHLGPSIDHFKLVDLRPEHLVALFVAKRTEGLSPRSVKYLYTTIRKALDMAVEWGAVARNVARSVKAPQVPRVEISAPIPDELSRLLSTAEARGDRLADLWTVAAYSGCREAELLGLKWSDVDLASGKLSVRRTLARTRDGVPDCRDPKTTRSRRTLTLPPDAIAVLSRQRLRQDNERQCLGNDYADHDLVFATQTGTPLGPRNVTRAFKRALERAGLSNSYTLHGRRHANATISLLAGIHPNTVADRLGHHSPAFTLERYTHAMRALDDDAADRLQAALKLLRQKAADAS